MAVAGLHTEEVGAPSCVGKQPSRLPALQRKQSAFRLLMASEPPWFHRCAEGCAYGDDVVHLQSPLVQGLPSNRLRRSTRSGPWRV